MNIYIKKGRDQNYIGSESDNWLELQISQDNDCEPNLTEQNAESDIIKHKGPDTEIQPMNSKILPETQNDLFSILLTDITTNLNMGKKWTEPSLRSQKRSRQFATCDYH